MTSDRGQTDDQTGQQSEATDPPPGPTDQGRSGGMATREVAPDVVKRKP
ncbi:hypothetical protein [Mycobacterium sp. NPDC006124]